MTITVDLDFEARNQQQPTCIIWQHFTSQIHVVHLITYNWIQLNDFTSLVYFFPFYLTFCVRIMPGPEVIKLCSCSTQLSTKFQLHMKTKILIDKEVSCFKSLRCCIYHANKC